MVDFITLTASTVNTNLGERKYVNIRCTRWLKQRSARAERRAAKKLVAEQALDVLIGVDVPWGSTAVEQPPVTRRVSVVAIDRTLSRPLYDLFVDEIVQIEQTFYISR